MIQTRLETLVPNGSAPFFHSCRSEKMYCWPGHAWRIGKLTQASVQVAQHNTIWDCWVTLLGQVFDVTTVIKVSNLSISSRSPVSSRQIQRQLIANLHKRCITALQHRPAHRMLPTGISRTSCTAPDHSSRIRCLQLVHCFPNPPASLFCASRWPMTVRCLRRGLLLISSTSLITNNADPGHIL